MTSKYAPPKDDLILHITTSVQNLTVKFANPLIIVAGDFNDLSVNEICDMCNLKQVVKVKTRKEATIELILTNHDNTYYKDPKSLPKIGNGDHFCVLYEPKIYKPPIVEIKKIPMRHYPKSSIIQFGSWITHSGWEDVFNIADVNNKTDYFISLTWQKIDYYFPTKLVKLTNTDKEWMTTNLKKLISQRQKAHNKNQIEVRDCLAKKIRLEIKDAKLKYKTKNRRFQ